MTVWWLAALVGFVVVSIGGRRLSVRVRERRELATDADAELTRRADQQNRWATHGDSRGIYGPQGAELMKTISSEPRLDPPASVRAEYPRTAAVAYMPENLATLLAEKLPCWRWAAFASVLVQRRADVQSRLRDDQLGYSAPSGERVGSGAEVGRFVVDRMDELLTLVNQVESFMLTPAFVGVFGQPGDESSADAEGIVHTANRLMDYHERFLGLAERCRGLAVPSHYEGLLRDLAQLMDVPLVAYRAFIDDFVERVGEMPEMLHYAHGTVELDPVVLHMDVDDKLLKRITKQLKEIAVD
jgi:hypothetical protein